VFFFFLNDNEPFISKRKNKLNRAFIE